MSTDAFGKSEPAHQKVLAAEYVRMSTEHQQYSTQNQAQAIREYAKRRGYSIVRTYADDGKSGLRIEGRQGLKRLIQDVEAKATPFQVVLVYDISRWGRFQDSDESAYYEYICKRAGLQVVYCAEQFENDGSPTATIIKSVKRAMAGEYSRELSVKVFAGQCRLVELGFRQGGSPGFGLKRLLIDQNGQPKAELNRGERKSLQTDRVVLVPGDQIEVETVQRMYKLLISDGLSERDIANRLNGLGIANAFGRPWNSMTAREVLTNEKYCGANVYNKASFKLKKIHVVNPPEMWVRKDNAFEPVVSREIFNAAQEILRARTYRYSNEELLVQLRSTFAQHGKLSAILIDQFGGAGSGIIAARFGGLIRAYRLVGYDPGRDMRYLEINRHIRLLYPQVLEATQEAIACWGGRFRRDPANDLMHINDEFALSVVIARCKLTPCGRERWRLRFDTSLDADVNVAVRLNHGNSGVLDYYIVPRCVLDSPRLSIGRFNEFSIESFRCNSLEALSRLAQRLPLPRAA
jgi:DNA invertase Pin-like site-specific DNA recombinase